MEAAAVRSQATNDSWRLCTTESRRGNVSGVVAANVNEGDFAGDTNGLSPPSDAGEAGLKLTL